MDWNPGSLGPSEAEQLSFLLYDAKAGAHASALQKIVQTADSIVESEKTSHGRRTSFQLPDLGNRRGSETRPRSRTLQCVEKADGAERSQARSETIATGWTVLMRTPLAREDPSLQ